MSGAAKAPLAAEKPLFDSQGVHWQGYGKEVFGMDGSTCAEIRSYHNTLSIQKPCVMVNSFAGSFNLSLRLTPDDAEHLARALLAAAKRTRDVMAAIEVVDHQVAP